MHSSRRDAAAFFILGLLNNLMFVVYLSAAEDLMPSKAGVILLCNVLPGLVTKLVLPFFAEKLSYTFRVAVTSLSLFACCLGVASYASTSVRLTCISITSASGALGEATFLSLTALYDPSVIGSWSSGTGMAGLMGSVVYYFLHVRLSLSSTQTLYTVAPLSLGMLITYIYVLSSPEGSLAEVRNSSYTQVPLSPSHSSDTPVLDDRERSRGDPWRVEHHYRQVTFDNAPNGSSSKRLAFRWLLANYITPLMLVYVSEYVINQGISGTLDHFGSGPRPGAEERSHVYTLYQTSYQLGVFISRSSIEFVKFPRLWMFPCLQVVNLVFLLASARWEFLPHYFVVMAVMFWEGLIGGGMYVNAFYKLRRTVPVDLKAWALGTTTIGDAVGISAAAFISIWLECAIRKSRGEPSCHAKGS